MTAKVTPIPFKETEIPDELRTGTKLLHGQYEITDYLNSGGFGITYLAKDSLDRQVVIKECFASAFCRRSDTVVSVRSRAHTAEFTSLVRLFVQEAKNLAKLKHPNIVGVHQIFEDNDTAYMALDYVNGRDLLDLIEDPNDRVSASDVQSMTLKLLNAIGYIHSTGVLHRDISPDNVLLERGTNNPVLIDFGAAREEIARQPHVITAMRVVKDGYSPQEFYIQGSEQTPSSDLYAFGATLYHLITGQCPPDSQSRLAAIASQKPDPFEGFKTPVKGYSEEFLNAIVKAMQIFPYDRIQSAKEWIDIIRPGPELVALPGGNRITPRRVVSQRLEDAQAEARADDLTKIPPPDVRSDDEIEVLRAKRPDRPQRAERKQIDFLTVRTPEPATTSGGSALPMILGAVAACVVVGLGVVYFLPGGNGSTGSAPETAVSAPASFETATTDNQVAPTLVLKVPGAAPAPTETPVQAEAPPTDVAVAEPNTPLTEPQSPLTTAPALGTSDGFSESAPQVLATIDPNADSVASRGLAPAPQGPADADAPTVDLSPANKPVSQPVEADGDVQEATAVMSRWTVSLPFEASNNGSGFIGTARPGAPEWAKRGTRIVSVGGRSVTSVDAIPDAVRHVTAIAGKADVKVEIGYVPPGGGEGKTAMVDLPAVMNVALLNGMEFQATVQDGKWTTRVLASPDTSPNGLRAGDILMGFIPTSEKIDGPATLARIFKREVAAGTTRYAFAVNRNGDLWVSSLDYSAGQN